MKVKIRIDPSCGERKVIIITDRITPEIEQLAASLNQSAPAHLTAHSERGVEFLPIDQVIRIYTESQKVLVQTLDKRIFALKDRLYEYENRLSPRSFVRISNSEIVNAAMITGMDFSLSGTICLFMKGGIKTFASRRYVSRIRKMFDV